MYRKITRLYHTVKFLKLKQIIWRIIFLLPRLIRQVENHPAIIVVYSSREFINKQNITEDFKFFRFLNFSYNLYEVGWDNKKIDKLWLYNLHYFEFLSQENIVENQKSANLILLKWVDENRFGIGTAWEPYPTSLRIINWIKWYFKTKQLSEKVILSIWNQTRWLANRPEYHLLGNHLFINSKAMLFSCAFFELDENSKIYKKALKILNKELDEQFLKDGAHFELSPMYHSLAMEDLLDLIAISSNLPSNFPINKIKNKFKKGMEWLETMIYNNEELSHFNDCANSIAPKYSDLKKFAIQLGLGKLHLQDKTFFNYENSGFIVFKNEKFHLISDVGHVGPDYLPGHSHADTLSFELAIYKHRIFVNSGTSVYGISHERHRQRGTSSHSTVEIDNQNSSEVWSGFRVARRARPLNVTYIDQKKHPYSFNASHDGYKKLKNSPIHKRTWTINVQDCIIEDEISGKNNLVVSRYYLHPDLEIFKKNDDSYIITKKNTILAFLKFVNVTETQIIDSTYHDEFGITKSNKHIKLTTVSPCKFKVHIVLK